MWRINSNGKPPNMYRRFNRGKLFLGAANEEVVREINFPSLAVLDVAAVST